MAKKYRPFSLATVSCLTLVASFSTVAYAPARTAPDESVTIPCKDAVNDWAKPATLVINNNINNVNDVAIRGNRLLTFFKSTP